MFRFLLAGVCVAAAFAGEPRYELAGQVQPPGRAAISLYGATSPFTATTFSDGGGRFRFKKLVPGAYTIGVYIQERGEARLTAEVGPGTADSHGRVSLTLDLKDADFETRDALRRQHAVTATELALPAKALREYEDAQKDLARRDVESAVKRLEHAVELAPQFSAAWNNLGTIAYQTRNFLRAEECFREALAADPAAYEPLVNLGGVLLNLRKLAEAMDCNLHAMLARPHDALANSQLGMTYFEVGNFDLALKYLERAREIDPAHFSHPQLMLAEIHLRRGENRAAADDLEDFVKHHPDYPQAEKVRENIAKLRQ
ncbi:MAG: tetratricopeptide repeat protein [Acidobacteriia bacterium]|nr:tetratricopeptide repeat protein [Terriglobia bacterium]